MDEEEKDSNAMQVSFHGRLKVQSSRVLVHASDSEESSKEESEPAARRKERVETQYRLQATQVSRSNCQVCHGMKL